MSEYKKIDKPGWWENEEGQRCLVVAVHAGLAWRFRPKNSMSSEVVDISAIGKFKHLTDDISWNWQPEPEIEEIDFPDWILPGWDYVTRDKYDDAPEVWNEQPKPGWNVWNHPMGISADRMLDFVDTSWVPVIPKEGWERAIWKRKPKQDDGWIEWGGGKCPVDPVALVEVRFRCGETDDDGEAICWGWDHGKGDYDIVAYRIIE